MRVVGDAIATDMGKRAIHKSLPDAKDIADLLDIVALLLQNWDSRLEILRD
jgi:hypothetical protein